MFWGPILVPPKGSLFAAAGLERDSAFQPRGFKK